MGWIPFQVVDRVQTDRFSNAALQLPVDIEWYAKWETAAAEMYQEMLTE